MGTVVWILWDANPYEAWDNNHRGIYATREAAVRAVQERFGFSSRCMPTSKPGLERVLRVRSGEGPIEAGFLERYEVKE